MLSVVMAISISAITFIANATICYEYSYGHDTFNRISTTASIQANPDSYRAEFLNAYATHRADPNDDYISGQVQLSIIVVAKKLTGVSQVLQNQGIVSLSSNKTYINFSNYSPYGYYFADDDVVYQLEGTFEAYYPSTGEIWYTPSIILTPEEDAHYPQ